MNKKFDIPGEVIYIAKTLEKAGFEAYLVGGCVRDLLMDKKPKDWDVTTNATPEKIIDLFPKTVYENKFGTVAVIHETLTDETLRQVEVTPYRIEAKYSDNRHPDFVKFSDQLEDDLKRRDFTVNAIAYNISNGQIIDLFNGLKDIKDKTIRAVGDANERFQEDALRLIRAIRFSAQLGFAVSQETFEAITKNASLLKHISKERIRDELSKIIMTNEPMAGIAMLEKTGLLDHVIPELKEAIKVEQKGEHIYDVWEHLLRSLQHAADKGWSLEIRLSALLHDIGKPKTRRAALGGPTPKSKKAYTFYGHEV